MCCALLSCHSCPFLKSPAEALAYHSHPSQAAVDTDFSLESDRVPKPLLPAPATFLLLKGHFLRLFSPLVEVLLMASDLFYDQEYSVWDPSWNLCHAQIPGTQQTCDFTPSTCSTPSSDTRKAEPDTGPWELKQEDRVGPVSPPEPWLRGLRIR